MITRLTALAIVALLLAPAPASAKSYGRGLYHFYSHGASAKHPQVFHASHP